MKRNKTQPKSPSGALVLFIVLFTGGFIFKLGSMIIVVIKNAIANA